MIPRLISRGCIAVLFASLCAGTMGSVRAQGPDVGTEAQRESGKNLYLKNCVQCHGENGKGDGFGAPFLVPTPRDFTSGQCKFRTTASGQLPARV